MGYIPEKFTIEIQNHLVRNMWKEINKSSSLILGISGPPGEGKSYQTREVLEKLGYGVICLSTADFGSALEAEAAKFIRCKYVEATALSRINVKPFALVCDDIDVAIGQFGDLTQYTVNRQYAIGELMHICDSPEFISNVDKEMLSDDLCKALNLDLLRDRYCNIPVIRTPIIVTGNDFGKLYDPLKRAGRITLFDWQPDLDEKINIVADILTISQSDTRYLLEESYQFSRDIGLSYDPPISLFATLKSRIRDEFIRETISNQGWEYSKKLFLSGWSLNKPISVNNYLSIAKVCIEELKVKSHINNNFIIQSSNSL